MRNFKTSVRPISFGLAFFISAAIPCAGFAAGKAKSKQLEFPDNAHSMATVEPAVRSIFRLDDKIFLGVKRQAFFILSPFKGIKKDQEETFGTMGDSKRIDMEKDLRQGNWQGLSLVGDRILLLDGDMLRLALFKASDQVFLNTYSIAWDMLVPARDKNGEPTKVETQQLRARFAQKYRKAPETKFTGLVEAPKSWQGKKGVDFLISTRIEGFPIVLMRCDATNFSGCQIVRACNVEGHKFDTVSISGLAYSPKRNLLVMGDQEHHRLLFFKASSCFDIRYSGSVSLDPKIRPINGVQVDSEDRLWIAVDGKDDYHNASVYTWDPDKW